MAIDLSLVISERKDGTNVVSANTLLLVSTGTGMKLRKRPTMQLLQEATPSLCINSAWVPSSAIKAVPLVRFP
eukprot:67096-Hanusia_phi.AAC.1